MGDNRIANKNFNPYDLGSVARVSREIRSQNRSGISEPYVPLRPKGRPSAHSEAGVQKPEDRKS